MEEVGDDRIICPSSAVEPRLDSSDLLILRGKVRVWMEKWGSEVVGFGSVGF